MKRRRTIAVSLAVAFGCLAAAGVPARAQDTGNGVPIIAGEGPAPAALPPATAVALAAAKQFAADNPTVLAPPWADDDAKVVFGWTTSAGRSLVEAHAREVVGPDVGWRVTQVTRSHRTLEAMKDDAISLTNADVAGAGSIFASYVDARHNRVVVESGEAPPALLAGLAARYGADGAAVRLTPGADGGLPAARNNDTAPFWGGANINTPAGGCTSGFPWLVQGSEYGMVTAGHCVPDGGSVSTPAQYMGSVHSGSRETWRTGTGTVTMTGQSTYRGDLALVSVQNGTTSGTSIYVGGVSSTSSKGVDAMWSRRALEGDSYCTGGAYSGERCGWSVNWTQGNWKYSDGQVARNVSAASKKDHCIKGGDSGGPTYTATSTMVTAKGIISGATGYGGGDAFAGALESSCRNVFTDIWDAYYGFPGTLRTQ